MKETLSSSARFNTARANVIDPAAARHLEQSRKYRIEPGNKTDYHTHSLADLVGCKADEIYRAEYGFGKLHVILYLRDGTQKSFPIEALFPVLVPTPAGYVVSETQTIKEY